MKKQLRFRHLLMLLLVVCWQSLLAQNRITGTVTDGATKTGIPGVSVLVKGTKTGTATDASGNFSVNAATGSTLVFSIVGYLPKEVAVGSQSKLDVALAENTENLEEVVVTALGIKRDAKKLGYSVTTVKAEAITENRTPNFMNALQGLYQ